MRKAKIGLEVHIQLTKLKTKLFCSCPSDYRDKPPNTVVCPVCLGLPGALPKLNEEAVKMALTLCLSLNGKVSRKVVFARKHYFYPDLPKGYQITQFTSLGSSPVCQGGQLVMRVDGREKVVRIRRLQLEEDPGRIVWPRGKASEYVLVDYNRSGIALIELVTEPDMETPEEARAFVEKLRSLVEHLGICDCELEGAMRVDANVSVEGGERVEIKNIGSIKDVEKALKFEITRQSTLLDQGGRVERETRHWDAERRVTVGARSKELEEEYRYMPEPNIPPYLIEEGLLEQAKRELPELPDQRIKRMIKEYSLSEYLASVLVIRDKRLADLFEEAAKLYTNYKRLASLLVVDYLRWVEELGLPLGKCVKPEWLAELLSYVDRGKITLEQARETVLPSMLRECKEPSRVIEEKGLGVVRDVDKILSIVRKVLRENPKAVEDAKKNPKAINFLVGQVMKALRGKADPRTVRQMIESELGMSARHGSDG
ncbi:Asp-tRNA(Asn)/Glu-tRNA(Gln) amidotransferase subunit GatB [Ignicoccus hospitalis]|uniref:Aspartyl/glutamyl-tRNA(Asn/Gln) amidotransferase subunit B n=1 Tax=Ignicoccus hospitalis (strain KIN4/I / DSM 18386 / JCM 14125) TaxID=453591 RepID=A8A8E5_IGNH4|nr:Asp-tRNA(Asn)/Glu-tRNA(Gln) amidotransferase subunit GatB [Ignicoccus hospitalis]ABU81197.1 aspartyl/glutamyl-tRNA(Asn/Gln) amidotransferase subunit B [Ignicoccus hospitalis KIN4/I]HIH90627.1 Asp-tRNA(Asn)/Glu-tRNA(Gln) amidotransferase subunit GatB [Desulfurococcaceae archaeon]